MLVADSALQERQKEILEAERQRQETLSWLRRELDPGLHVRQGGTDPTNAERQTGRALSQTEVEKRLTKQIPQLRFLPSANPSKKYVCFLKPDGQLLKLTLCESGLTGLIPEHSIMQAVIKEELDPDVVRGRFHIDRKDLPKHEIVPHEFAEDGTLTKEGGVLWDPTQPIVGMKREKRAWSEVVRGYRTLAAMLVSMGYMTPTQAEIAFGSVNRPEWQKRMGKKDHILPW